MPLEKKGVDIVQVDSFLRLIFTANDSWVVPATADERRYAVFEVPDHRRGDRAFWAALYAQIEGGGLPGFLAYLQRWQVPEGVDVRQPPHTVGLDQQKLAGLRGVEKWWFDHLSSGVLPTGGGFDGEADSPDWSEAGQTVDKEELRAAHESWTMRSRWQGEAANARDFGVEIKRLCPGIRTTEPRGEGGKRIKCYRVPVLREARGEFAAALNITPDSLAWGDDDE